MGGGVNTPLAKDDVRSRCRLVVNIIKCTKQRPALCYYYCSCVTQTHHNSVHSIQINEVLWKLWCVHLLHLMIFTTSLLPTPDFIFCQCCIDPPPYGSCTLLCDILLTTSKCLMDLLWCHIRIGVKVIFGNNSVWLLHALFSLYTLGGVCYTAVASTVEQCITGEHYVAFDSNTMDINCT